MIVVYSLLFTRTLFFSIKAFGNNILKYIINREEILNGLCDILGLCVAVCYMMRGFDDIITGYKKIILLNRWNREIEVRDSIGLLSGSSTISDYNYSSNTTAAVLSSKITRPGTVLMYALLYDAYRVQYYYKYSTVRGNTVLYAV